MRLIHGGPKDAPDNRSSKTGSMSRIVVTNVIECNNNLNGYGPSIANSVNMYQRVLLLTSLESLRNAIFLVITSFVITTFFITNCRVLRRLIIGTGSIIMAQVTIITGGPHIP